jgi:hypothetical protein
MIEVTHIDIKPTHKRLGIVNLKYYDLRIKCDICVWEDKKLWIRFPETWNKGVKLRHVYWENKDISDKHQQIILKKVFDMIGLDLQQAVILKKAFFNRNKNNKPGK